MPDQNIKDSMLDIFIFETVQNIEQLEQIVLNCEKSCSYDKESIDEIFRIMHTIKGSSAMMFYNNISSLAHKVEDIFFYIREQKLKEFDCSKLTDLVFDGIDFIKVEIEKIKAGDQPDGDAKNQVEELHDFLESLKKGNPDSGIADNNKVTEKQDSKSEQQNPPEEQHANHTTGEVKYYKCTVWFEDDCGMENLRAFAIVHRMNEISNEYFYIPEDIVENDQTSEIIRKQGFAMFFSSDKKPEIINDFINQTTFLKNFELTEIKDEHELEQFSSYKPASSAVVNTSAEKEQKSQTKEHIDKENQTSSAPASIISVNVTKLDRLMDLVGEVVIAEAMVTQNPELKGLVLDNFKKSAQHLHKIINELQDLVMSIRLVPLASTFQKMNRIVRDMSKKLDKNVRLEIIGEETEVDKNIIEHISDPLMHLVRNSLDHGLETKQEREASGKDKTGVITIEAKNEANEVIIIVRDDGKGFNKEKILKKAKENGLVTKPENELTDKEIYSMIFLPGFSTKDKVTEFSGRGVGMDVVVKNVEKVGGKVIADSVPGQGSAVTIRIPLTLAIIDGMNIRVGESKYTIPITDIKESFRPKDNEIITDPDGNEMIMVRGQCYPIVRLDELYRVEADAKKLSEGILIMIEKGENSVCVSADELIGEQQVVVKSLPIYLKNVKGFAGCTLLGDGSISLIIDTGSFFEQ